MKKTLFLILALLTVLTGCAQPVPAEPEVETAPASNTYRQISQEEAREMMDGQDVLILDVREQDEFDAGHIPGAVLLSVGSITEESAGDVIPDKDSVVLVYCRSGNRSKTASQALADLGYTNIYEFGGISTWPYELEQ